MRIWCNLIKAELLGAAHDPGKPQAYRATEHELAPVSSVATWQTWWDGDAIPQTRLVNAVERLSPGSSAYLDLGSLATPMLRQLYALDLATTRFRLRGNMRDYRRAHAHRLLAAINRAWGEFLDHDPPGPDSHFHIDRQTAPLKFGEGLVADVTPDALWTVLEHQVNPRRLSLPAPIVMAHNWLDPLSIIPFLGGLASFPDIRAAGLLRLWTYDFASSALALRTLLELSPERHTPDWLLRMGSFGYHFLLAMNTYWAPADAASSRALTNTCKNMFQDEWSSAKRNLLLSREHYYTAFEELGIPEKAARALNGLRNLDTWDGSFTAPRAKI